MYFFQIFFNYYDLNLFIYYVFVKSSVELYQATVEINWWTKIILTHPNLT